MTTYGIIFADQPSALAASGLLDVAFGFPKQGTYQDGTPCIPPPGDPWYGYTLHWTLPIQHPTSGQWAIVIDGLLASLAQQTKAQRMADPAFGPGLSDEQRSALFDQIFTAYQAATTLDASWWPDPFATS